MERDSVKRSDKDEGPEGKKERLEEAREEEVRWREVRGTDEENNMQPAGKNWKFPGKRCPRTPRSGGRTGG